MTPEELESDPLGDSGGQWLTLLASLVVGGAFFALWFWLLPGWLGFSVATSGGARWRWLAAVPSVLGFYSPAAITVAAAVGLAVHLFVIFYEEPTLRNKFRTDYEDYCRNVNRWWPRLRAWERS